MFYNFAWRIAANLFNQKYNPKQQSAILYLHRILPEKSAYTPDAPTAKELDTLLSHLGQVFEFASLDRIIEQAHEPRKRRKPLLGLTFDDGYLDSFSFGAPLLAKHKAFATYFVSSGGVDSGILWQDQLVWIIKTAKKDRLKEVAAELGLPELPFLFPAGQLLAETWLQHAKRLSPSELKSLIAKLSARCSHPSFPRLMISPDEIEKAIRVSGRIDIGGHTVNHSILTSTENEEEAFWEIAHDKAQLEQYSGRPVRHFCYPNGFPGADYQHHHIALVKKAGYLAAFTTADGGVGPQQDVFQLPRLWPYRNNPILKSLSTLKIAGETPCQLQP